MAYRHHFIQNAAEVPSRYQMIRRAFEEYDPSRRPSRHQRNVIDDFMGNTEDRLIHSFFDQARFTANDTAAIRTTGSYTKMPIDNQVYNRIKPALRLASILLLRHVPLWSLILYAPEIIDVNGRITFDEANFTNPDQFQDQFLHTDLPNMAKMTLFGRHTRVDNDEVAMASIAWAAPTHRPQDRHFLLQISCTSEFWSPFQTTSDWDELIHEEKCNNWVHLAVTLVHEFAHCLGCYRQRRFYARVAREHDASPNQMPDPLTSLWPQRELGYSFEMAALGGLIDMHALAIARVGDFAPPIFTCKGRQIPRMRFLRGNDANAAYHADLSPDTVVALMQESTWADNNVVDLYLWIIRPAQTGN